jgi:hypothetical protein
MPFVVEWSLVPTGNVNLMDYDWRLTDILHVEGIQVEGLEKIELLIYNQDEKYAKRLEVAMIWKSARGGLDLRPAETASFSLTAGQDYTLRFTHGNGQVREEKVVAGKAVVDGIAM